LNEATNGGARLIDHAVASEILVENRPRQWDQLYHLPDEAGPKTGDGSPEDKFLQKI